MIPGRWLPPLPPAPADGWLPVYYELSEESGVLRQGAYRVHGDRGWARNDVGVRFLPRERDLDDVVIARRVAPPPGSRAVIALLAAASAHNRAVVSIPPPVPTAGVPYGLFITFHLPSNTPTSSHWH
jgi:hypothetical protein